MVGPRIPVRAGLSASKVPNIPEAWSASWFRRFITNHLQQSDTRNSVAGANITITSATPTGVTPQPATVSSSGSIFNSTTPGLVPASGGGTANFLRADGSFAAPGGGITGFGNPTAKVGTAVVNGAASTAMRSDAAPPIDLAITPTWTSTHTFNRPAIIGPFTVATLPAVGTFTYARAIVSDSTAAPAFGAIVAGGGGTIIPVYSDGVNWRVG